MILDAKFPRSVVYYFCFWDFVESLGGYYESTDAFAEVSDLNLDIPEESIS